MTAFKNDPAVRAFRDTLGMFPTGVTVVTARGADGAPVGLTVSSFNSVSLVPPLVVWSLSGHLDCVPAFKNAAVYAINVLAEDQQELSARFAGRADDKFAGLDVDTGEIVIDGETDAAVLDLFIDGIAVTAQRAGKAFTCRAKVNMDNYRVQHSEWREPYGSIIIALAKDDQRVPTARYCVVGGIG